MGRPSGTVRLRRVQAMAPRSMRTAASAFSASRMARITATPSAPASRACGALVASIAAQRDDRDPDADPQALEGRRAERRALLGHAEERREHGVVGAGLLRAAELRPRSGTRRRASAGNHGRTLRGGGERWPSCDAVRPHRERDVRAVAHDHRDAERPAAVEQVLRTAVDLGARRVRQAQPHRT